MLTGGLAASAVGLTTLAGSSATSPSWAFELGLGLLGAGIGLTMPPATGAIMASLPAHKAGVGSAVNDLDRELGGAFGIGVLASITLSRYRSLLSPALASLPAHRAATEKAGLAQTLATTGDAGIDTAARHAFSVGLDLAMVAGACCVAAAAIVVYLTRARGVAATDPSGRTGTRPPAQRQASR